MHGGEESVGTSFITKLREPRIQLTPEVDIAVFDTVGTVLIGVSIARLTGYSPYITIPASFAVGHAVHIGAGVKTPLTRSLANGATDH